MIERSDAYFDQPGEFKIKIPDSINEKEYLIKRKSDVTNKLNGRKMDDLYKIGIIVRLFGDNNPYIIVSRLSYSEDGTIFDYSAKKYNDNSDKIYYFDHEKIEKAYILKESTGKKR